MGVHLNSPRYYLLLSLKDFILLFKATVCSGHILLACGLVMYSMQIGRESDCCKKKKKSQSNLGIWSLFAITYPCHCCPTCILGPDAWCPAEYHNIQLLILWSAVALKNGRGCPQQKTASCEAVKCLPSLWLAREVFLRQPYWLQSVNIYATKESNHKFPFLTARVGMERKKRYF